MVIQGEQQMPTFILKLSHSASDASWSMLCMIEGEAKGFSSVERNIRSDEELIVELKGAGISSERSDQAMQLAHGESASFEISQNEAQKLSILHTDSPE
jgi:hypothetical protein